MQLQLPLYLFENNSNSVIEVDPESQQLFIHTEIHVYPPPVSYWIDFIFTRSLIFLQPPNTGLHLIRNLADSFVAYLDENNLRYCYRYPADTKITDIAKTVATAMTRFPRKWILTEPSLSLRHYLCSETPLLHFFPVLYSRLNNCRSHHSNLATQHSTRLLRPTCYILLLSARSQLATGNSELLNALNPMGSTLLMYFCLSPMLVLFTNTVTRSSISCRRLFLVYLVNLDLHDTQLQLSIMCNQQRTFVRYTYSTIQIRVHLSMIVGFVTNHIVVHMVLCANSPGSSGAYWFQT